MNASLALKMRYKRLPFLFMSFVIFGSVIVFGNLCSEVVHLRDLASAHRHISVNMLYFCCVFFCGHKEISWMKLK